VSTGEVKRYEVTTDKSLKLGTITETITSLNELRDAILAKIFEFDQICEPILAAVG
jgi:hypothetical protein